MSEEERWKIELSGDSVEISVVIQQYLMAAGNACCFTALVSKMWIHESSACQACSGFVAGDEPI